MSHYDDLYDIPLTNTKLHRVGRFSAKPMKQPSYLSEFESDYDDYEEEEYEDDYEPEIVEPEQPLYTKPELPIPDYYNTPCLNKSPLFFKDIFSEWRHTRVVKQPSTLNNMRDHLRHCAFKQIVKFQ